MSWIKKANVAMFVVFLVLTSPTPVEAQQESAASILQSVENDQAQATITPAVSGVPTPASANASRAPLSIGGPNGINGGGGQGLRYGPARAGVQYGGGEGVRYGTANAGVQYGGGQGLRYGTPNAGVKIGGGEGYRIGTRNLGVQYGGGQVLRWGTPNAGVKVGGGEGFRIGTSGAGIKIDRSGLQIGRFRN